MVITRLIRNQLTFIASVGSNNINYSWLKYGTGEMESNFKESILNDLADEFNLDETDQQIVSNYMKLDPISKKAIKDYLKSLTLLWKDENGDI